MKMQMVRRRPEIRTGPCLAKDGRAKPRALSQIGLRRGPPPWSPPGAGLQGALVRGRTSDTEAQWCLYTPTARRAFWGLPRPQSSLRWPRRAHVMAGSQLRDIGQTSSARPRQRAPARGGSPSCHDSFRNARLTECRENHSSAGGPTAMQTAAIVAAMPSGTMSKHHSSAQRAV